MKKIMWRINRFFWRIKNLIKWFPIIWNLFDWDYVYALEVFKFQLKNLADFLDSDKAYTEKARYNAQRIRTVIRLMDKVYNEEYGMEYMGVLDEKYGFKRGFSDNVSDEYNKDMKKLMQESNAKQEKAHKLLWKLIEKDIRGWWD